ncbi:MAG: hypothetical protein JWM08_608 [Candidatus Angelobacter sp.]|nr:hypothetical protein [Candidatus Angelobacter sp.]
MLKSVADELQKPAKDEQSSGEHPEWMVENGDYGQRQRYYDQRNAEAMAKPVNRVSMTACVLCNPLLAGASA